MLTHSLKKCVASQVIAYHLCRRFCQFPVRRIKLQGKTTYKAKHLVEAVETCQPSGGLEASSAIYASKVNHSQTSFPSKLLLSSVQKRLQEHMRHGKNIYPRNCMQMSRTCQANQPRSQVVFHPGVKWSVWISITALTSKLSSKDWDDVATLCQPVIIGLISPLLG